MTAQEIRKKYLDFMVERGHKIIPRASLVPQDDPTTLFTVGGMQPLIPYLLGESHPEGNRLVDSQPCVRTPDIEDIGDGRHFTFFEMLGNWSLGDYFKKEQLGWFFEFLTDVVGLDPEKLYVTCFSGDRATSIAKDLDASGIWQDLFKNKNVEAKSAEIGSEENGYIRGMKPGERIFYYDANKNWWSRAGEPEKMPVGEPGGPDSEVFFDTGLEHNPKYGEHCHPNCDCGRFIEIGNSVFMAYKKTDHGIERLPKPNVDFGGGLERIAAAAIGTGDAYKTSLFKPVIDGLENLSGKKYEDFTHNMRVIADHLRAATFLVANDVVPSNKERGYVLRRLLRRAIRYAFDLGIEQDLCEKVASIIIELYESDFPEVKKQKNQIIDAFTREEKLFRQTLRKGLHEFERITKDLNLDGKKIFMLYDTYGFPVELIKEEAFRRDVELASNADEVFEQLMEEQRQRSHTASVGMFKGGLADHSEQVVKYHTTTHLMYQALRDVLGPQVVQRGSNITVERIRFDFSYGQKMTLKEIKKIEDIVNQKIAEDLPVTWKEENTKEAFAKGASGAFGDKYGETVKVYTIGDPARPFSREICGGPHVEHTGVIGEGGKKFKITKEEASSAGVRRIKAVVR